MKNINMRTTKLFSDYQPDPELGFICSKTRHRWNLYTPGLHNHRDFYELVIVADGKAIHEHTQRSSISTGRVLLLPPLEWHSYLNCADLEIYNVLFQKKVFDWFLPDLTGLPGYKMLFERSDDPGAANPESGIYLPDEHFPEITALLDDLIICRYDSIPGNKMLMVSTFLRVITLICRHAVWREYGSSDIHVGKIAHLLNKLDASYSSPWNLAQMAQFCRMSVSSFRSEFKLLTGFSPVRYLVNLRLQKAAVLLAAGNCPLEKAARLTGFNDVGYFSRQFKKYYGTPPGQWQPPVPIS